MKNNFNFNLNEPGQEVDKIVFKPVSYEELIISLERLQRFNNPFKKYDRVCREILIKHLIFPKISLKNYFEFSFGTINFLMQLIWNESVRMLNPDCSCNYGINLYLFYEEIKEFSAAEILKRIIFSENINGYAKPADFTESDFICKEDIFKDLFEQSGINFENEYFNIKKFDAYSKMYISLRMNYPLNLDGLLQLTESKKEVSGNIKRLAAVNNMIKKSDLINSVKNLSVEFENLYDFAEIYRNNNSAKRPFRLLILTEGATEEILLPVFSSVEGINFDKAGIEVIASGGKNRVERIYDEISREINIPVFIILDADACKISDEIKKNIRIQDRLHLISGGEFEDILPDDLICRAVNSHYGLTGKIIKEELNVYPRKTDSLAGIWKQKGFGEFKKAEFAGIIAEHIKNSDDLSEEMKEIISKIKKMIL